ncbi:MAG: STAS domain-containing protein [Armatimonadota bacterium]
METIASVAAEHPDVHVLTLEGEAGDQCPDIERLEPLLNGLIVGGARYLIIEMTGVSCIGHAALATLAWGAMELRDRGGDIAFAVEDEALVTQLQRLRLDGMIPVYSTVAEAAAALAE